MISHDGIEVRRDTDVFAAGCVGFFRKPGSPEVCSCTLRTAIGFTRIRLLAVLLLNHGRPVGTNCSLY